MREIEYLEIRLEPHWHAPEGRSPFCEVRFRAQVNGRQFNGCEVLPDSDLESRLDVMLEVMVEKFKAALRQGSDAMGLQRR
jgi:hypothetical protein